MEGFFLFFLAGYLFTFAGYFAYEKAMRLGKPKCMHRFTPWEADVIDDLATHTRKRACIYCRKVQRGY